MYLKIINKDGGKQMKISKILAGMSAAALAASMMSLAAFADETATVKADLTGGTVSLIDEKDDDGVVTKTGVLTGTNVKLSDVAVLMLM